jgi:hypothetical protein
MIVEGEVARIQRPSLRRERSFGLAVGSVFVALGGWWMFRGRFGFLGPAALAVGSLLVILGVVLPRTLVAVHRGWMVLAEGLSWVSTRVILLVVYVLVVTPIGVLRRLFGADPLGRRSKERGGSWQPYPKRHRDSRHYEKTY